MFKFFVITGIYIIIRFLIGECGGSGYNPLKYWNCFMLRFPLSPSQYIHPPCLISITVPKKTIFLKEFPKYETDFTTCYIFIENLLTIFSLFLCNERNWFRLQNSSSPSSFTHFLIFSCLSPSIIFTTVPIQ